MADFVLYLTRCRLFTYKSAFSIWQSFRRCSRKVFTHRITTNCTMKLPCKCAIFGNREIRFQYATTGTSFSKIRARNDSQSRPHRFSQVSCRIRSNFQKHFPFSFLVAVPWQQTRYPISQEPPRYSVTIKKKSNL